MSNDARSALNADQAGVRTSRARGANSSRQAVAAYEWPQEDVVVTHGKWRLFTLDSGFDYMTAWVDVEDKRIVVAWDTWATLAHEETAIAQFFKDVTGGATGMKFIVADSGPYALAARRQAVAEGQSFGESDPIAVLTSAANSLVMQASSMNRRPTAGQQGIFAERYARLRSQLADLEARVAQIHGALDLAGAALYEVTQ